MTRIFNIYGYQLSYTEVQCEAEGVPEKWTGILVHDTNAPDNSSDMIYDCEMPEDEEGAYRMLECNLPSAFWQLREDGTYYFPEPDDDEEGF